MRRLGLCLAVSVALVLVAPPASAGGWWTTLDLQGQYLGVGESLEVGIHEVMWDSIGEAEGAEATSFYAYLVRNFNEARLNAATRRADPGDWWRPLSPVVLLGKVELRASDSNLTRGVAHLEVPAVAPGRYFLMLCDAGCRTPLANHVPVSVRVTTDPLTAQTARRLDRASDRMRLALARMRGDLRGTERRLDQAELEASHALDAVADLRKRPSERPDSNEMPWIAYAGWLVAGAVVTLVLTMRTRKRLVETLIERAPDDARELTGVR